MPVHGVCVRCGRETLLVDGRLCPECFIEVKGVGRLPSRITITRCPRCGSVRIRGRWLPPASESLEDIVALVLSEQVKPHEEVEELAVESVNTVSDPVGGMKALITFKVRFKGIEGAYRASYTLPLHVKSVLCPTCFRRAAGAAQAIVQVRGWSGPLKPSERELVRRIAETLPGVSDALLDVEERREGIDIKLLDQAVARTLASKLRAQLGARIIESHKVVGRRSDGKPRSKLTISVRLPFFKPGTYIIINRRLAYVEAIRGGRVVYRYAGSGRRHSISVEEAWKLAEPVPEDRLYRGVVTAVEPGWLHIQVLEPVMEYLELPRKTTIIEGRPSVGEKVVVVRLGREEYVIEERLFS